MAACFALIAGAAPAAQVSQSGGCEVIAVLSDEPVPPQTEAPLTILPVYDANVTAAQRAVIEVALDDWRAVILDAGHVVNPYFLSFQNGPLGSNTLAQAQTSYSGSGVLTGSAITIDNDGSSVFYIDPTPESDEEFSEGDCNAPDCMWVSDLLTVMRHEIGHALGWTGAYGNPTNPLTTAYISGLTFDGPRLDIAMDPAQTAHSDPAIHPGNLMNPTLDSGTRIGLSWYPTVAFVGRNIDHDLRLRIVDAASSGVFALGTGDFPHKSVASAFAIEPAGRPLLLIDGTYVEGPLLLAAAHELFAARGSVLIR